MPRKDCRGRRLSEVSAESVAPRCTTRKTEKPPEYHVRACQRAYKHRRQRRHRWRRLKSAVRAAEHLFSGGCRYYARARLQQHSVDSRPWLPIEICRIRRLPHQRREYRIRSAHLPRMVRQQPQLRGLCARLERGRAARCRLCPYYDYRNGLGRQKVQCIVGQGTHRRCRRPQFRRKFQENHRRRWQCKLAALYLSRVSCSLQGRARKGR